MLMVATRRLSSRSWRSPQPTSSTLISGNFHWVDTEKSNRSPLPANRDRGPDWKSDQRWSRRFRHFWLVTARFVNMMKWGLRESQWCRIKQMGFTATRNLSRKGICLELAIRGMALALILMKGGGGEWGRRGLIVQ
ncbi:hypothetical protein QQ045_013488 [Rhodiola kirilowii]